MQSNFGAAEIGNQHFMDSNSSVLPVFNPQKQNQDFLHQQFHQQQPQPFHHLSQLAHPIPITHDLFQRQNQLQFQALLQQQQQAQQEEGRLPWQPSPPSFKLGLSESSGPHNLGFKNWKTQEYYGIRRESMCWKPLDAVVADTTNKRQRQEEGESCRDLEGKHRLYGELEAIYSLAKMGEANQNQTGSGSALTGENCSKNVEFPVVFVDPNGLNAAPADNVRVDNVSEASIGEELSVGKIQKRKRKRKMKEQLSSMTRFFENLVKQVVDHQENLHKKYLEVIEKMGKERREREEAWRYQAEENHKRETMAKLHEQALASSREALIVSYIEEITGQRINLPPRQTPLLLQPDNVSEPQTAEELTPSQAVRTNSRWPQSEVEALILVRGSVESKFVELGSKGHVWEEVSALMASMGYQKSARRCKQKWENINKYFRKTKHTAKKRPLQSKTCSYFNQLGQLYSKTPTTVPSSSSSVSTDVSIQRQGYSELLEAFVAGRETEVTHNLSNGNFEISEMGFSRLDFNGISNGKVENVQGDRGKEKENDEDGENMDEGEDTDGDDSDE
ncbi:trihelix transcription factor DF1-like [Pyrus communis]|uniref:trihelix transcription factor DF1-like n=1 Tax=Pyrus communis TaxID=23211 RepID=UPI0035C12F78